MPDDIEVKEEKGKMYKVKIEDTNIVAIRLDEPKETEARASG